jgi:hypothetical protein
MTIIAPPKPTPTAKAHLRTENISEPKDPFDEWMKLEPLNISDSDFAELSEDEEQYVSNLFSSDRNGTELVADVGGINVLKKNLRSLREKGLKIQIINN